MHIKEEDKFFGKKHQRSKPPTLTPEQEQLFDLEV